MSTTPVTPTPATSSIVQGVATVTNQINNYLPLATQAVLSVEQTLANAPSQTKLTTALGLVMAGAKTAEQVPVPSVAAIGGLVDLIASIVQGFNASGLFKHSSTPTTVVPSTPIAPVITPLPAAPAPISAPVAPAAAAPVDQSATIASLQAQIAALSAQLSALTAPAGAPTATSAPVPVTTASTAIVTPAAPAAQPHPNIFQRLGGNLHALGSEIAHPNQAADAINSQTKAAGATPATPTSATQPATAKS